MKRLFKITVLLALALALGFMFGINNTQNTVEVYDKAGNLVASQADQGAGNLLLPGLKAASIPWYLSRSSAIAAYLLLFCIVVWGMGMAVGLTYKFVDPARAWQIHQDMSISFGVLVIIHAFSLLFDSFIGFKILDILLPFYSGFKPVFLSLGIVGFYLLLIIIFTSIFVRLKSPRLWRYSHFLVYPLFIFATMHGLSIGTDSKTMLMQGVYGFASVVFVALLIYRFLIYPIQIKLLK